MKLKKVRDLVGALWRLFLSHRKWIMAYCLVGAISAVVNFATFSVFWRWFELDYRFSVSIAYVFSVIVHFSLNRNFTFKSQGAYFTRHLVKYLIMLMVNYTFTLLIVTGVVDILGFSPYLGIAAAIALTMWTGYIMAKFWVFNNRAEVK